MDDPIPNETSETVQVCRLCAKKTTLVDSHVIPAFVFRWLKETSSSGHLRSGETPNRRIQDGYKLPLLCLQCDRDVIGPWEASFSQGIFPLVVKEEKNPIPYDQKLPLVAASLVWRALIYQEIRGKLSHFSDAGKEALRQAEVRWREFILSSTPSPEPNGLVVIPFSRVSSLEGIDKAKVPPSLNAFLLRLTGLNLISADGFPYEVVSKLGPVLFLGIIRTRNPDPWKDLRLSPNSGVVAPNMVLPRGFFDFLCQGAGELIQRSRNLSEAQLKKIERSYRNRLDKPGGEHYLRAVDADVRLFGVNRVFGDGNPRDTHSESDEVED